MPTAMLAKILFVRSGNSVSPLMRQKCGGRYFTHPAAVDLHYIKFLFKTKEIDLHLSIRTRWNFVSLSSAPKREYEHCIYSFLLFHLSDR